MSGREQKCTQATILGRLRKARQFSDSAEIIREFADDEADVGDAYVTLAVHAGIAASDAICCHALGVHAQGDDHQEAIRLIQRVNPNGIELGNALNTLLRIKTRAGYSAQPVTADMRKRAGRAAEKLVLSARDRIGGSSADGAAR